MHRFRTDSGLASFSTCLECLLLMMLIMPSLPDCIAGGRDFCLLTILTFSFFGLRKEILVLCQTGKRFESLFFLLPAALGWCA